MWNNGKDMQAGMIEMEEIKDWVRVHLEIGLSPNSNPRGKRELRELVEDPKSLNFTNHSIKSQKGFTKV